MFFNWGDDTHKRALLLSSHHPQIKMAFSSTGQACFLRSEVVEEGGRVGKGKKMEGLKETNLQGKKIVTTKSFLTAIMSQHSTSFHLSS